MGHDPEYARAFDSRLLFDVRRLPVHRQAPGLFGREASAAQSPCSPRRTGKRTGLVQQLSKPSAAEAHA
jgi:hypothetical protein